jgi:hypothetical protein
VVKLVLPPVTERLSRAVKELEELYEGDPRGGISL